MNSSIALGLIICAFIALALVDFSSENKRTRKLRVLSEKMRWSFSPTSEPTFLHALQHFRLFSSAQSRKISNMLRTQRNNGEIIIFDYTYGSKKQMNSNRTKQTVFLYQSSHLALPTFRLYPRTNLLQAIGKMFGAQVCHPKKSLSFSEQYALSDPQQRDTEHLFSPTFRTYYAEHPGLTTEANGKQFIMYSPAQRIPVEQFQKFVEQGIELIELFTSGAQSTQSLLTALHNNSARIRQDAVRALGFFHDTTVFQAVCHTALHDPDKRVSIAAIWALGTLRDVRAVNVLLSVLHESHEELHREAMTALHKVCPFVDIVIFGQERPHQDVDARRTVWNLDVTNLTIPIPNLQHIVLDVNTYDFYQVERFIAYAMNILGQKTCKKHIDVHVYGSMEKLHPNLKNNLTNLCKHLYMHHEDIFQMPLNL